MKYNLCLVFSPDMKSTLVIKKNKGPYPDKLNSPGGKIEDNESQLDSVYRELNEETGYKSIDGWLCWMMDISYSKDDLSIWFFKLVNNPDITEIKEMDEGTMFWISVEDCFLQNNINLFAGDGNFLYFIQYALKSEGVSYGQTI
jgi:8-oxo-dGTP pyrophosphatase MutT (NUDIX family)